MRKGTRRATEYVETIGAQTGPPTLDPFGCSAPWAAAPPATKAQRRGRKARDRPCRALGTIAGAFHRAMFALTNTLLTALSPHHTSPPKHRAAPEIVHAWAPCGEGGGGVIVHNTPGGHAKAKRPSNTTTSGGE